MRRQNLPGRFQGIRFALVVPRRTEAWYVCAGVDVGAKMDRFLLLVVAVVVVEVASVEVASVEVEVEPASLFEAAGCWC